VAVNHEGGLVMQIPVLIEPVAASGFRARSGEPLSFTADGTTREEALQKLKEMLETKLHNGSELTTLNFAPQQHPLAPFIGRYDPNDPMIEEWREAVEDYRRQKDEEEEVQ
jgi:predicted RNase H-like HicB family nuclease